MIPASYHPFFSDAAEVAGTLIGLLFVAVSIDPDRFRSGDITFRVRATVAFAALTNCLFVTLIALLPGENLPVGGRVLAVIGLVSCGWTTWISLEIPELRQRLRVLFRSMLLGAVFVLQLIASIDLGQRPHTTEPVSTVSYLIIAGFAIAIERSWELVGASGVSLITYLERIADLRRRHRDAADPAAPQDPDDDHARHPLRDA